MNEFPGQFIIQYKIYNLNYFHENKFYTQEAINVIQKTQIPHIYYSKMNTF